MTRNRMRGVSLYVAAVAGALLLPPGAMASAPYQGLPLEGGKPVLARINGEPLMLEEFERLLAQLHAGAAENSRRSVSNPAVLLDRMINARLVLQEARNIGLDELPEVQAAQKVFEEDTLRGMLYAYHVRNIVKPDPKEVDKRYREAVKEVKLASVLFDGEEGAKQLAGQVRAGGRFEALAKKSIDAGTAKGATEGQYLKFNSLSPEVARVVSSMKKGETSPAIRIGSQFSVVKLEDVRYPKDEAARKQAEKEALQGKQVAALEKYAEQLRKKYAKVDRKLFDAIDYEAAEPGFDKLREDQRVVATVQGEKPVTVADLTGALEKKFFHGAERAVEEKKINRKKEQTLYDILNRRVALKEARVQKLDRTRFFKEKVAENRSDLLIGTFVRKVILPDIKVSDEEVAAYYREHAGEYAAPEMVRIDGLAFTGRNNAEDVLVKLRGGASFQWLRTNAEGQADPAQRKDLLPLQRQLLEVTTLPDGVQKAIAGASAGDFRLYAGPGGVYYVLAIVERIPSRPMPLESVKGAIGQKVFSEKLERAMRGWEEKLRQASDIKIYATGKKLDRLVNPGGR